MNSAQITEAWVRDGYVSPLPIISEEAAARHRARLEQAEAAQGPLHYKAKIHTVMRSPLELATHPRVLDAVEAMIGPDILLYNVTYIIKEPQTASHVSWHQDLTFWGLSDDAQVSLWLALSPASERSGCMRMVPGSHRAGRFDHKVKDDPTNVLLQSQTVHGIDEAKAVMCPLAPGEASFHHGWLLHASMPNRSSDRRIGLNAQYIAPKVRQLKHDKDTAMLVRGRDLYGYWGKDAPAEADFAPTALARWRDLDALYVETAGTA